MLEGSDKYKIRTFLLGLFPPRYGVSVRYIFSFSLYLQIRKDLIEPKTV